MVSKIEELEAKTHKVIALLESQREENSRLKMECESLKSHLTLLAGENEKAQKILAEYDHLRKRQDQITHRVERALSSLNNLKMAKV